jgi:hypothetical protein
VKPKQAAQLGGLALSSKLDPQVYTLAGRQAFAAKFFREVDPEGVLDADERVRRGLAAMRLHYLRMAYRSAQVRRRNAARRREAELLFQADLKRLREVEAESVRRMGAVRLRREAHEEAAK